MELSERTLDEMEQSNYFTGPEFVTQDEIDSIRMRFVELLNDEPGDPDDADDAERACATALARLCDEANNAQLS